MLIISTGEGITFFLVAVLVFITGHYIGKLKTKDLQKELKSTQNQLDIEKGNNKRGSDALDDSIEKIELMRQANEVLNTYIEKNKITIARLEKVISERDLVIARSNENLASMTKKLKDQASQITLSKEVANKDDVKKAVPKPKATTKAKAKTPATKKVAAKKTATKTPTTKKSAGGRPKGAKDSYPRTRSSSKQKPTK